MVKILVVKREELFKDKYFEGFLHIDDADYIDRILKNYSYEERNESLENNPEFIQIIPYIWIINPGLKKAFFYQRGLGKGYKEKRHVNRYSGGVGGHIDFIENDKNPIINSAERELREELIMKNYPKINFVGYINDDSDIYNKVHFAIVGIAETKEEISPTKDGIKSGDFYSIDEIEELFSGEDNEVEKWTQLSWSYIKNYLNTHKSNI